SSRKVRIESTYSSAATTRVSSPKASSSVLTRAPSEASIRARSSWRLLIGLADSTRDRGGTADLGLQLHQAIDQGFGGRRATRHVDIDRHDPVAAAHHRVGVVVVAPAIGAGTHRQDPAWFGHLVVELAQGRRHLVAQGAG